MAKKSDSINISIFTALKVSEISKVPAFIISNPGIGKSTTVSMFAKVRGYDVVLLRGNTTTAEEIMGYDTAGPEAEKRGTTTHLNPAWFAEIKESATAGRKTLLFLDEITTANEFVQAALLHLVFERMVGREHLPEDTLIVAAGNYAQNLSATMQMLPPMMNRFMIYNIIPEVSDLDTFLCKFEGAIVDPEGKPKNYMEELMKKMKAMDDQQIEVPADQYNKIGEYIEKSIKETTKLLMGSAGQIDMTVTDLQNIYSDAGEDGDPMLYGFVSFRTLNYLRDVAIASFICFGKNGIMSDNFKNMINGLCGIGISRDRKSGDIKKNKIGNEYYNSIVQVTNEIEKMKNDKLPHFEKFFNGIIIDPATKKERAKFEIPELQAISNKLDEFNNEKSLKEIDKPISAEILSKIFSIIDSSSSETKSFRVNSGTDIVSSINIDKFSGYVRTWNNISEVVTKLSKLISDPKRGYKSSTIDELKNLTSTLKSAYFKLNGIKTMINKSDPTVGKLIPELKSIMI